MKQKLLLKISGIFLMVFVLLITYLPLFVMFLISISTDKSGNFLPGVTFKWYLSLGDLAEPILFTLLVSVVSTFVSVIFGTFTALGVHALSKKRRRNVLFLNNIPVLNADVVTGVTLFIIFQFLSLLVGRNIFGITTTIIAHVLFSTPYVILSLLPKLNMLDDKLYEAALDLGASPFKAFFKVILPNIKGGIIAGAFLAFTMSIDDFIITYFVSGDYLNISTWLFSNLKTLKNGVWNKAAAFNSLLIMFTFLSVFIYQIFVIKRGEKLAKKN